MFQFLKNLFQKKPKRTVYELVIFDLCDPLIRVDTKHLKKITGWKQPGKIIFELRRLGWEIESVREKHKFSNKVLFYKLK